VKFYNIKWNLCSIDSTDSENSDDNDAVENVQASTVDWLSEPHKTEEKSAELELQGVDADINLDSLALHSILLDSPMKDGEEAEEEFPDMAMGSQF
jgi:hypothetical protein